MQGTPARGRDWVSESIMSGRHIIKGFSDVVRKARRAEAWGCGSDPIHDRHPKVHEDDVVGMGQGSYLVIENMGRFLAKKRHFAIICAVT